MFEFVKVMAKVGLLLVPFPPEHSGLFHWAPYLCWAQTHRILTGLKKQIITGICMSSNIYYYYT